MTESVIYLLISAGIALVAAIGISTVGYWFSPYAGDAGGIATFGYVMAKMISCKKGKWFQ